MVSVFSGLFSSGFVVSLGFWALFLMVWDGVSGFLVKNIVLCVFFVFCCFFKCLLDLLLIFFFFLGGVALLGICW